jgi:hypothetical protein
MSHECKGGNPKSRPVPLKLPPRLYLLSRALKDRHRRLSLCSVPTNEDDERHILRLIGQVITLMPFLLVAERNLLLFVAFTFSFRVFCPKIACQAPKPPNPFPSSNIRVAF